MVSCCLNDKQAYKIGVALQILCVIKTASIIKNHNIYTELYHYSHKLYL